MKELLIPSRRAHALKSPAVMTGRKSTMNSSRRDFETIQHKTKTTRKFVN